MTWPMLAWLSSPRSQVLIGLEQGRLDLRVVGLGQVGDVGNPLVEGPDPREVVDDGFLARDRRQPSQNGVEPARRPWRRRLGRGGARRFAGRPARVRFDVDQPALDLTGGRLAGDRLDGMGEREVVQHPTVNEVGMARPLAGQLVGAEELPLNHGEVRGVWLADIPHELGQAHRRERTRETRRRPGRERQRGIIRPAGEVILAPPPIKGEADHVAVGQVTHHQRLATQAAIPDREITPMPTGVSHRSQTAPANWSGATAPPGRAARARRRPKWNRAAWPTTPHTAAGTSDRRAAAG